MFNLDADRSVTTLHAKNNAKRAAARDGYGGSDSGEEENDSDSASDERNLDKLPGGMASDKEVGEGENKAISWSPPDPSVGRLTPRKATGGG